MTPGWWNLRSPRYWLVVAAAVPVGLLLGALLTTQFARPPGERVPRAAATVLPAQTPHAEAAASPATTDAAARRAQDTAFVRAVYLDVLGAPPAQATIDGWLQTLDRGASRVQVAAGVLTSPEYGAFLAEADFQRLLGRPAADAAAAWADALRRGAPPEQLVAGVLGSDEFYGKQGGTPQAWITALYRELLGRDPAPEETAAQLATLERGAGRTDIAFALSFTEEYRRRFLDAAFHQYLGRPPTDDELRWLLAAMASGRTTADVRAALLGSDEYLRRHAPA